MRRIESQGRVRKNKRGFTLTETVVAMGISLLVIGSFYTLFSHSMAVMRAASAKTAAMDKARLAIEYARTLDCNSDEMALLPAVHETTIYDGVNPDGVQVLYVLWQNKYHTADARRKFGKNPFRAGIMRVYLDKETDQYIDHWFGISDFLHAK